MGNREQIDSWRLQTLTPIEVLPDYDENPYSFWGGQQSAAPVEPDGSPVYYRVPESFEKAKNDGERWRWALAQAASTDPGLLNTTRSELADFLLGQFGTQTMAALGLGGGRPTAVPRPPAPMPSDTLKDEETIARLATGVKRFKLPDDLNPIKIFQTIAGDPKTGQGEEALDFTGGDLRESPPARPGRDVPEAKSRELWRQGRRLEDATAGPDPRRRGVNSTAMKTQPAGRGATVDYRFRNGRRVHFEAHEVDVRRS